MHINLNVVSTRAKDVNPVIAGSLKIKGAVNEKGVSIPCRVRLFEKLSGRLVEDKVTDNHGNYEFNQLTASKFFIVTHHPTSQFNAVIQDNVVPK